MRMALPTAFALSAFFASTVFALDPEDLNKITLDNATGRTIAMVFLSPGDSKFWGPDLMGADYILKDGASATYYVHYPGAASSFDLMAVDDKGNKFEIRDLQLVDGTEARVTLTRASPTKRTSELVMATARIANRTRREIQYLFVRPGDSQTWGADLLGEEMTLADGRSYSILLLIGRSKMKYSLMAVDENNDEYRLDVTIDPKARKEFTWAIEPGRLVAEVGGSAVTTCGPKKGAL